MNIYYIAGMITLWLLVLILIAILGIGCYFLWVELLERRLKDKKIFKEVLIRYMIEKNKKIDNK